MLVIVALIGVVGYMVYKNNHITTTATTLSTSSNKPATSTLTQTTTQQKYLAVKELGIKLPLSNRISDLIYTYTPNSGSPLLTFSTTSLDIASPSCTITSSIYSPRPFGSVNAVTTPYPQSEVGPGDNQAGILYAHVNGYYLYWKGAQSDCQQTKANGGQPSQTEVNLLNTQLPLFQAALKDAVAD